MEKLKKLVFKKFLNLFLSLFEYFKLNDQLDIFSNKLGNNLFLRILFS